MNGVTTVVNVYLTPGGAKPAGQAEIIEVLKYLGDGWYRIKCVMCDDSYQTTVTRYYNTGGVKP